MEGSVAVAQRIMSKLMVPVMALLLAACGQADGGADAKETAAPVVTGEPVTVLAFGDSLFAGYKLARSESYPAKLERALRARGLNVTVRNAGVSGDTTAAGLQRLDFVLDSLSTPPDLVLVELGANDMLRGLSAGDARANLDTIMTKLNGRDLPVMLYEMKAAPNLGGEYGGEFNSIYPTLADKHDAELVPFFIEPLIFDRSLVQSDQVHPTAEGVDAMVEKTVDDIAERVEEL